MPSFYYSWFSLYAGLPVCLCFLFLFFLLLFFTLWNIYCCGFPFIYPSAWIFLIGFPFLNLSFPWLWMISMRADLFGEHKIRAIYSPHIRNRKWAFFHNIPPWVLSLTLKQKVSTNARNIYYWPIHFLIPSNSNHYKGRLQTLAQLEPSVCAWGDWVFLINKIWVLSTKILILQTFIRGEKEREKDNMFEKKNKLFAAYKWALFQNRHWQVSYWELGYIFPEKQYDKGSLAL